MTKPLTAISIANLKPRAKRFEVSDPGCSGLRVAIFPSKKKSFIVRYRYRGVQKKLTLGPVLVGGVGETDTAPELDTPLSLAAARELATRALREAKSGKTDPAAEKQRKRQQELAAESDTLSAIAQEYLRREGGRLRSLAQRRSDLDLICASGLGRLPVASITRGQFTRVIDHISDHNGPVRADRALSALRTLLNWHSGRSDYVSPLVRGFRRPSMRKRERVLSDDELRAVWRTAEQDEGPFGSFVRFTLLTATRRGESAGLRRSELSADGVWTIPGVRYKSGRDVLIPLSAAAQRIVAAMPVLAGGDYVFSATGSHPLSGFDDRKKAFDKVCSVQNYTLHDLRRTARTLLSKCPGVTPDIAERCLGHSLPGLRATYDRHEYATEKLHAFEALAALIDRIVHPPAAADVVVPIRKARRK